MTVVRELLTVIGFPVDESSAKKADQTFGEITKSATQFAFSFNQAFDAINTGISVIAGAADAIVSVPEKLISMAEESAALGDRVAKTGRQLGITAEQMQRLEFAADRSGLAASEVRQAIQKLGKNAADAGSGLKGPIENFKRLGVSVKDSEGNLKSIDSLLPEVADAVKAIEDPAERAAVSMRVMGGSGAQMLPLLLEGSKGIQALKDRADELGFVMTNETAAASEKFIDQLTDMRRALLGVSTRLGAKLFPALGGLVDRFTNIVTSAGSVDGVVVALAEAFVSFANIIFDGIEAIQRHSKFLKIMGIVLAAVASVIFIQLLPTLYGYIAALNLVTLAQLKAVAIPALMVAGFLALSAVIALVIEDIHAFVSGGESAIGNLYEAFLNNPAEGDEHWMMTMLRFIVVSVHDAVVAVDAFFRGFFEDAEEAGSVVGGLGKVWDTAVDFWMETIKGFFSWMGDQFGAFSDFADNVVSKVDEAILGAFQGVINKAKGLAGQLSGLPLVGGFFDGEAPALAGARSPSGAPVPSVVRAGALAAGGGSVSNSITRGALNINVSAPSGSPNDVASATAEALEERLERDRRETQRILEAGSRAVR